MTVPSISVLLPVRDCADHLPRCIASLTEQTDDDFEVVVVDDGSRDGSSELLRGWATVDPRVRLIEQGGRGLVPALERARSEARGRWLARMDGDDVSYPGRLAAQRALMESDPTLALCGAGVRYVPRDVLGGGALRYERWLNELVSSADIARDVFVECPLAHPTFFMQADAAAAVGGYRDMGWPEDYDLLLRLWRAGAGLGTVPEVLLDWRERPNRLSRTHPAYSAEAFRRCKAHHLRASHLRARGAEVLVWGAGPVGKAFARALVTEGVRIRAFVDLDPRKIGQEIHAAPVIAPEEVSRHSGTFCVAAVGQPGARAEIRLALAAMGWEEGEAFVAVA